MKKNHCPACGKPIRLTVEMAGQTIPCSHCQKKLTVPAAKGGSTPPPPPPPPADPDNSHHVPTDSFSFPDVDDSSGVHKYTRRRKSLLPLAVGAVVIVSFGAIAFVLVWLATSSSGPAFKPRAEIEAGEGRELSLALELDDPEPWLDRVVFELVDGPPGATLEPASGQLRWTPEEKDGPGQFSFTVRVTAKDNAEQNDTMTFAVHVLEQNRKPELVMPDDMKLTAGETLDVVIEARDLDVPEVPLAFSLVRAPEGAEINQDTGRLTWLADPATADRTVEFVVSVSESKKNGLKSRGRLRVSVVRAVRPVDRLITAFQENGLTAEMTPESFDHPFRGTGVTLLVDGALTRVIEYASEKEARDEEIRIATHRDRYQMPKLPDSWVGPVRFFRKNDLIVVYAGLDPDFYQKLISVLGDPIESAAPTRSTPAVAAEAKPEPEPDDFGVFSADQAKQLLELYDSGKLFEGASYPALRAIFAGRFEREQAAAVYDVLEDEHKEVVAWLEEHPVIKEELFLAIDPKVDNVPEVLRLFCAIKEKFPDQIVPYANLAIAVAVTWDNQSAVNVQNGPLRQGKAIESGPACDALGNFSYFVEAEPAMQGRAQWLPWEFLIHCVNHKTPLVERQWALQNYLAKRVGFGACYKDVPYDTAMLDSGNQIGKIHGKLYTLPNLRLFGGVCAHQADFATRVGKCLGVPAAYVSGQSRYGANHAWVMWVEVMWVNQQGIGFKLESYGRYRGDKYYVGNLREPQSGRNITDRQLELRLHMIGINPVAKRQADMVMDALPTIAEERSLDVVKRFQFLRDTLTLCPGNEAAWTAIAKMSGEETVREKHKKEMLKVLDQLFVTFAAFPDFTWTVFDDLIAFETSLEERIKFYSRLVTLYEMKGRPDLACEARLRLADMLVENSQTVDAIQGLAFSIMKFPEEGRYVPRMLDKLELLCDQIDGAKQHLIPFYAGFLPRIPPTRGDRPSEYCMEMFERGIQRFQQAGQLPLAQRFAVQLELIRMKKGN